MNHGYQNGYRLSEVKHREGRLGRHSNHEIAAVENPAFEATGFVSKDQGYTFEASIDASNVMLIDPTTEDATRVKTRVDKDGTKERISVRSGNPIPTAE